MTQARRDASKVDPPRYHLARAGDREKVSLCPMRFPAVGVIVVAAFHDETCPECLAVRAQMREAFLADASGQTCHVPFVGIMVGGRQ